ncbi:MAG: UDP-N-acetylmuramoyl-L-alanine--D-glutamate ligase [Candidatus Riflebacteria bacterium]|nr:UDP-N-acetylmuramoyl-L-alanine--D-glutamate ligase [Candidatus Riflebacteria bacterium]
MPIQPRKALVYGIGRSGLAAARLLAAHGTSVSFYDDLATELPDGPWGRARLYSGALPAAALDGLELAIVSPGVHPDRPAFLALQESRVPFFSEIELASRFTEKPLVGVTGTNGKSTTVTLVRDVLLAAGHQALAVGNIGYPFSAAVLERPDADWYAVEVSSYQLATIERFRVRAGVVTNLAANHGEWHGSQDNYFAAKLRLFDNMQPDGVAVYPAGCEYLAKALSDRPFRKVSFTWGGVPGDVHWEPDSQRIVWRSTGEGLLDLGRVAGKLPYDFHSVLWNLLAAVSVGRGLALPIAAYARTLDLFRPLAHRLEPMRVLDGVRWVNDSKSTNVESTRYALENTPSPLVLMVGGRDKGLDFALLAPGQQGHVRAVVALGECREKIKRQLDGLLPVQVADDFGSSIGLARRLATRGDTVLFSPACASFDMFRNFEHRGDVFKQLVNGLDACGA